MGWGSGRNAQGREVGYSVDAICDRDGCETVIDRGLYYVCGGMHDGGLFGCGRYFCGSHFTYVPREWFMDVADQEFSSQLCDECADGLELAYAAHRYIESLDGTDETRSIFSYVRAWSLDGWAAVARQYELSPAGLSMTAAIALRMLETLESLS